MVLLPVLLATEAASAVAALLLVFDRRHEDDDASDGDDGGTNGTSDPELAVAELRRQRERLYGAKLGNLVACVVIDN